MHPKIRFAAVVAELQDLAGALEKSHPRFAERLDIACNTIERKVAGLDAKFGMPGDTGDYPPGWEDANEGGRYEENEQWVDPAQLHDGPIGPDSVRSGMTMGYDHKTGKMRTGPIKSVNEIDAQFASEDPVIIQATRKRPRRAGVDDVPSASFDPEEDGYDNEEDGNSMQPFMTSGLPLQGHGESVDENQGDLPEDKVIPYRGMGEYQGKIGARARQARQVLERVAGPVEVKSPANLWRDEPGHQVMRDQDLEGYGHDPAYKSHYSDGAVPSASRSEEFDFDEDDDLPVITDSLDQGLAGHATDEHFDYADAERSRTAGMDSPADDNPDFRGFGDDPRATDRAQPESTSRGAGRKASTRVATYQVYRPKFVPSHMRPVWERAVHLVANEQKFLTRTAAGQTRINYPRIIAVYRKAVTKAARQAMRATGTR